MASKEVVNYIKKELARGVHIEKIKKALVSVGHSGKSVEEAIKKVISKPKAKKNPALLPIAILVIVIVSLSVLGGVLWKINTAPVEEVSEEATQIPEEETAPEQTEVQSNIICLSWANDDVSYCDKTPPAAQLETLDYGIRCRSDFFFANALMNKDAEICDNIGAEDPVSKYWCLAAIQGDVSVCQNVGDPDDKIICEAGGSQDTSLCDGIQDDVFKNECLSAAYLTTAILTRDNSYCDKLTNADPETSQHDCLALLAQDDSLCIHLS